MAADIFLVVSGIPGESTAPGFAGAIEVQSFSWGISNSATTGTGGGVGVGKAQFSEVSIVKHFDLASPLLMRALVTGSVLPKMVLSFVTVGGRSPIKPFLTYEFNEVLVSSLQDSASGEVPEESVSFAYKEVLVTYQSPKGKTATFG